MCIRDRVKAWGIQKAVGKEIFTVQGEYSANLIRERVLGQTLEAVSYTHLAAGLAGICILSTSVLVMLSSTVALYVGMDDRCV